MSPTVKVVFFNFGQTETILLKQLQHVVKTVNWEEIKSKLDLYIYHTSVIVATIFYPLQFMYQI